MKRHIDYCDYCPFVVSKYIGNELFSLRHSVVCAKSNTIITEDTSDYTEVPNWCDITDMDIISIGAKELEKEYPGHKFEWILDEDGRDLVTVKIDGTGCNMNWGIDDFILPFDEGFLRSIRLWIESIIFWNEKERRNNEE